MDQEVRVRFAPSPTGYLHIGGVRTALYNYLFARQNNGKFVLRIEDTDQNRYVEGAEQYILEALQWAGIEYDEGPEIGGPYEPYRQSERKHLYEHYAQKLLDEGNAYMAFDTSEELEEMREKMKKAGKASPKYDHVTREYMKNSLALPSDEVQKLLDEGVPYVIRLKVPRKEEIRLKDTIRGWVNVQSEQIDDKVLIKADGMPTYHMANVVDDQLMGITHVIRGEEWLPSTPLHVLLYRFLGWEDQVPEFAHLPLILKPDGQGKLSKRDGERGGFPVAPLAWKDPETGEAIDGYRESGYSPEAFINILALLGWSPHDNRELFTMDELIEVFDLKRVGKSGAKFDPDKAKWFNQHYLRTKDNYELAREFKPVLEEKGIEVNDDYLASVCGLIKEKASFLTEFWGFGYYFFQEPESYDEKVVQKKWNDQVPPFLENLKERLSNLDDFNSDAIEETFKSLAGEMNEKPGKFMQLFRVVVSGMGAGPALFDVVAVLGKPEVIKRIDQALQKMPSMVQDA